MTWESVTLDEVEAFRQRVAANFHEYARRSAEAGDLSGYAAFDLAAQFVVAEPIRRCYSVVQNDTSRTTDQPVSESKQEVDVFGFPA